LWRVHRPSGPHPGGPAGGGSCRGRSRSRVRYVRVGDPQVPGLIDALTRERAGGGYTVAQTFGYSPADLERADVHLFGWRKWSMGLGCPGSRAAVLPGEQRLEHDAAVPQQGHDGCGEFGVTDKPDELLVVGRALEVRGGLGP